MDACQPTKNNHRRSWLRSLVICSKHCTTNDCESKDCPWMRFSRRKINTGDLCSGLWSFVPKVNLRMRNGSEDQNNEMLSHSNMFVLTYAFPHSAQCHFIVPTCCISMPVHVCVVTCLSRPQLHHIRTVVSLKLFNVWQINMIPLVTVEPSAF